MSILIKGMDMPNDRPIIISIFPNGRVDTMEAKYFDSVLSAVEVPMMEANKAIASIIREQPTADVVEVVHGEWIDTETGECKCSHCKNIYEIKAKFLYSYCPICGANMVKPITEMIDVFYANKHLYKKIGGKDEQIH